MDSNAIYTKDYLAPQEVPSSPFDRLAMSVERLHELRKMSGVLADRLAGAVPPNVTTNGEAKLGIIGGGGLLDGLDRQSETITDLSRAIYDNLSRIDSRL